MPIEGYLVRFVHLLVVPFQNLDTVWGILPVYVAVILAEVYETRMDYGRAVINGAMMLLVGADWAWHLSKAGGLAYLFTEMKLPWLVTACCIGVGAFTMILGLRRKDKRLARLLGHMRFSGYFLITLYPMQARLVPWTQDSLVAILVFAIPCWLLIYATGYLLRLVLK
ncbi:MAG: hypothetical protein N3A53_08010 [Verrucomicrobiae bacterium]|nr:hypothetical protein [Verrucomicrobiae bacterium]